MMILEYQTPEISERGGWFSVERDRIEDTKRDKRVIERKIRQGEATAEELQGYLQELPDLSWNAEEVTVSLERKKGKPAEKGNAH